MLSRREWLSLTLATGAAAALDRALLSAQQPLIARAVPGSSERLPIVGLGSSATFSSAVAAPCSTRPRGMERRKRSQDA
jgi:hypothetical protein